MTKVVGVKFYKNNEPTGKIYYYGINDIYIKPYYDLVVESDEGEELVKVCTKVKSIDDKEIVNELKYIKRISTKKDRQVFRENNDNQLTLLKEIKELVNERLPEMHVINARYSLNKDQLLIYFVSDNRLDFRQLVKDIASVYKTRIELRQVGVRDETKVLGGIGVCGRILCCNSYLSEFVTVSINMAKNQSLSLVPSKISGQCGRLLCCLTYEDEEYDRLKVGMPKIGTKYETDKGIGKVVQLNVLLRTFKVLVKGYGLMEFDEHGNNQ